MDILMETPFPALSDEIITRLGELYPVIQPVPGQHHDTIFYRAGQRSVINFLIEERERQMETVR